MEEKDWYYNTFVQMNKPMKFMGLSSIQLFGAIGILGLVVVVCMSFFKTKVYIPLSIDSVIFIPMYLISKKLTKEHKRGNSNYYGSFLAYWSTPKKIIDKNKVFNFLINE
jgi:hypothetical protein